MITGFYCTNIVSGQAKALIAFYRQALAIPLVKTDDDDSNGLSLSEAIRYGWGTYEVRLCDTDGNETVIAEIA